MQAIETRWYGPTNNRGPRITAKCDAGKVTIDCDGRLGNEGNHDLAAWTLLQKLKWGGYWYRGSFPGKGNVMVYTQHCQTSQLDISSLKT